MNANDRLKASWGERVAWSTALAAALHLALLLWFPALPAPSHATIDGRSDLEWIALGDTGTMPAPDGSPASLVRPVAIPAGDHDGPALVHAAAPPTTDQPARTPGVEALRDYLGRRTGTATIVDGSEGAGSGWFAGAERRGRLAGESGREMDTGPARAHRGIDGAASTTGEDAGVNGDALGLGRLSAIQPELAYHAPSPWILIQNPGEVESFMARRFRDDPASRVQRTVSVALWIDARGSVEWAEINRSSGRSDVDESALQLFSQVASYRPARQQGVRVPVAVIFSVTLPW